jgi:RHS repeat-associated protein
LGRLGFGVGISQIRKYSCGGCKLRLWSHRIGQELKTNNYYYQDGSGSTSHLANNNGTLLEWYRYDLQGTPFFYGPPNDTQRSTSNYSVRHLFTGQQWYQDIGLYDLRNRFYSPDLGRLLQPDPIGFRGDRTNLYRYCGNNPVTRWDPSGLQSIHFPPKLPDTDYEPQFVNAPPLPGFPIREFPPSVGVWPGIPYNPEAIFIRGKEGLEIDIPDPVPESPSVEHPPPSKVPNQNPSASNAVAAAVAAVVTTAEGWFEGAGLSEIFWNPVLLGLALPLVLTSDSPQPTRMLYHYSQTRIAGTI